jgi:hypothetical protein
MAEKTGCRTTIHCVNWGYCHRCDPELSQRVLKRWHEDTGSERSERYEAIIEEERARE